MSKRALVMVDETADIPPGSCAVGGVLLLPDDPQEVGYALTGGVVRVGSEAEAEHWEEKLRADGFDCLRSKRVHRSEEVRPEWRVK